MKKSILLIALGILFLFIAGCADNSATDKTPSVTPNVVESAAPSEEPSVAPETLYAEMLDKFYYNFLDSWNSYKEDGNIMSEQEDLSFVFPMYMADPSYLDKVGYCFVDLDDNSIPELLIGMNEGVYSEDEVYKNEIYDIYSYNDGEIIHLASSGERWFYKLCEDNTIYFYGSSGAASSDYQHLKLDKNSSELSVIQDVFSEPDESWENIYWHLATGTQYDSDSGEPQYDSLSEISEAEANGIIDSWPDIATLNLTMFSSYTPQSRN